MKIKNSLLKIATFALALAVIFSTIGLLPSADAAVYSEYLHNMCKAVCAVLEHVDKTVIRKNYQPFNWLPHVTIGKTLSKEQQLAAFEELQKSFGPLKASVMKIGLSKTNPYSDIFLHEMK